MKDVILKKDKPGLNSFVLRIIAFAAAIAYALNAYLSIGPEWLLNLKWIAYTITAFLLANGFMHSTDCYLYFRRLSVFALAGELPYNLANSGHLFDANSQNVMFTLVLALICMCAAERIRERFQNVVITLVCEAVLSAAASLAGRLLHLDMAEYGIYIAMLFYISLHVTYPRLFQFVSIGYISIFLDMSSTFTFEIDNMFFTLPSQIITLIALISIWLYNGRYGSSNKVLRVCYYAMFPLLCVVMGIMRLSM